MKFLAILLVLSFTAACGSAGKAGSGSGSFLSCEKVDLSQMIGDHTLIDTAIADLAKNDYVNAIEALITRIGSDAVGCAVLAIGEARTMTPATAASSPVRARARELAEVHGWKQPHGPSSGLTIPRASSILFADVSPLAPEEASIAAAAHGQRDPL